jgi:hypothetical protein
MKKTEKMKKEGMKVPPKRRSLQEPHGVTSQKTPYFKTERTYTISGLINQTEYSEKRRINDNKFIVMFDLL